MLCTKFHANQTNYPERDKIQIFYKNLQNGIKSNIEDHHCSMFCSAGVKACVKNDFSSRANGSKVTPQKVFWFAIVPPWGQLE